MLEATAVIQNGQVKVNDSIVLSEELQVYKRNVVTLDNEQLTLRPFRYLLMHKAANTVCSNVDETYPSVFNSLDLSRKSELHIVGRLDADTTGLVLLTDDGSWTYKIITPKAQCEKVYRVKLRDAITEDAIFMLENGIVLSGTDEMTLPAKITVLEENEVLLTITQGKFHQVKRMFRAVGNRVHALHREQVGEVSLDVELGHWRYLTRDEVESFL